MLTGSIYGWESGKDDIFDPLSPRNRDDCLEPMRLMDVLARQHGIMLHTADVNEGNRVSPNFSLYIESIDFVPIGAQKNYLILYETPLTVPRNNDVAYLKQFDSIFTWNTDYIRRGLTDVHGRYLSQDHFTKIQHPNPIPRQCGSKFQSPTFDQRSDFICLIGSNRHANVFDERELYSERVRVIQWFEANALNDFKLYGNGWKVPQKRLGHLGKMRYRLEKIIPWVLGKPVFLSYQGPTKTKYEVLSKTKFCICFENARDIPGYVTEKIFDCFFAGCVPVYWGDAGIDLSIPANCFINFRHFSSYQDLYQYLSKMTAEQFSSYQVAASEFLLSPQFEPFSSQNFAATVVKKISDDFEIV
jgi:hypothetical protein